MSSPTEILLYAELLSNIRQISVIASLPSPSLKDTYARLDTQQNIITVSHRGTLACLRLPARVQSKESLSLPSVGSSEISWRLPLADQSSRGHAVELFDNGEAPWAAKDLSEATSLCCRGCGSIVVKSDIIRIWKDLPSENWAEMMDFWHCHKPDHKHEGVDDCEVDLSEKKGYGANNRFVADLGTGFVDLTYFLLNPQDCSGIQATEPAKQLFCASCKSNLGIFDQLRSSHKLYKWSLDVMYADIVSSAPLAHFITAYLLSQIASQAVSKFVLHAGNTVSSSLLSHPPIILQIWVFAPRLTISLAKSSDATNSNCPPIPISKIFYKSISSKQMAELLGDEGNLSSSIEGVEFAEETVKDVKEALETSTASLPKSARRFGEYDVGFLERYVGIP